VLGPGVAVREPRLRVGETASCVLFDPAAEWTVGGGAQHSLSRNTPLWGCRLRGRVLLTMVDGAVAHVDESRLPLPEPMQEAARG
jgi:dihydroorotase